YHLKYNKDPRGVRKLEFFLDPNDLNLLKKTIPNYSYDSIKIAILELIEIYKSLRSSIFPSEININKKAESLATDYLNSLS
ncbi:streptomycin adenylyltransferase, partial [Leptospira ryugenii]